MGKVLAAIAMALGLSVSMPSADANVAILCYHEVDKPNDSFAVTHQRLEKHLEKMKGDGYHFVSLDEYVKYTKGEINLPEKSVMITFDDGYQTFYTKVYPLLQKYQVPGMLAIVSSWTNGEEMPNDVRAVATWDELKEMENSGLVTVVSHTHAMHKQQAINPQGGSNGVVGSHLYVNNRYETDEEYTSRITNDLTEVQKVFRENLGHESKAIVWPYGIYTKESVDIAENLGMNASFLLDGGINEPGDNALHYAKRMIISSDIDNKKLDKMLTKDHDEWNSKPLRLAQVDLDNIYDKDYAQYEENIMSTIENLEGNNINVVALQAFADPDGDGNVDAVYFANSQVPVAADIFCDVTNRMQRRGFTTVAWLPVLNYQTFLTKDNKVKSAGEEGWYNRLSPFAKEDLKKVNDLFRDLAKNTQVQGVLLQDDLYLGEDEDVSDPAKSAYLEKFGKKMPKPSKMSKKDKKAFVTWKREALDEAADNAISAFKEVRPNAITMRDIYSGAVFHPEAAEWLGQSYEDYLNKYDYTVVMAYPYMDKEKDTKSYFKKLANIVKSNNGTDKTIMKVQSYDWNKDKWLSSKEFANQFSVLKKAGMKNMGYYPATHLYWK